MRLGNLPPAALLRPWFSVGEVAERLPVMLARIPPIDPAEDQSGLGAVGQPYVEPDAGLPAMSEASLIRAHRVCACACSAELERMPWESWSPGQWEWYRRRQRVTAQRQAQREARREKRAG